MYALLSELVSGSLDAGSLINYTLCFAFLLIAWRVPLALARQWTSHSEARWRHEFNMRRLDMIENLNRRAPLIEPSKLDPAPPRRFDLEAKGLLPNEFDSDLTSEDCEIDCKHTTN